MAKIGKPKTTKAKRFGARKEYMKDEAPGLPMDDPTAEEVRKKSKAQAIRDAEGTGMALDAYGVDKEEGRLVKDSKGRSKTEFNPKTRKKRRGKTQAKMGGGKVHSSKYTSSNKRYANGGKIYPMVGK